MGNLGRVVSIILIVGFIVGIIYLVLHSRASANQQAELEKLNKTNVIFFKTYSNGSQIATGIDLIFPELGKTHSDKTFDKSQGDTWLGVRIPENYTFYAFNRNLEGQKYYIRNVLESPDGIKLFANFSMKVPLNEYGNLSIVQSGRFNGQPILLTVEKHGYLTPITICMSVSPGIIKASIKGFNETSVPSRYKNKVVRCYGANFLDNNPTLELDYTLFSEHTASDSITLFFIDRDLDPQKVINKDNETYITEDNIGEDVGMEDLIYKVE